MPVIAFDFDGIICEEGHWPDVGPIFPGAVEEINTLHDRGYCIIINSCRSGEPEQKMISYLKEAGVKFCRVNENCPYRIKKYGGDCRKISADLYLDDKNLLAPPTKIIWGALVGHVIRRLGKTHTPPCKGGEC